jgi:MoaA/NifB/PqqE/SkfB family radical SAM enzyme
MGKLLTIETGFSCNSRCQYCTQLDYRALGQVERLDLSGDEIRERIAWAARNGYDQLGFSGGEPTIRPDFLELVRYARDLDFERIGVTTNGRMFAYPRFAEQALQAGLDAFTFSLHGATPEVHDRIAAAPGALDQALQGLRNLNAAAERMGVRLHRMNNQILLPDNTAQIGAMVELLAPLGVRLFMVQPFIAQRSNVDDLGRFFVPYAEVVAAVEAALPALRRWDARIKPYNVPNCLLWPLGRDHVESQFYDITVYREFERETAGAFKAFRAKQWYRIDACRTCTEKCPGYRIEQYPQAQMQEGIVAAAQAAAVVPAEGPPLFSGTELLEPQTLAATIRALAASHGPVAWMSGASERTTRRELAELIASLRAEQALAEVVLVAQPMDQRFLAQRVVEKGNLEEIRQLLLNLATARRQGHELPRLRLLVNVGDALRLLDDEQVAAQWPLLTTALTQAAGPDGAELLVAIPNFPRGQEPPDVARQASQHRAMAERLRDAAHQAGLSIRLITLEDRRGLDPARAAAMALAEAQFADVLPRESWARRLFRHPLSAPELDFVSWSPPWLFERWDLSQGQPLPAGALPSFSDGADVRGFGALRQGAVDQDKRSVASRGRFGVTSAERRSRET